MTTPTPGTPPPFDPATVTAVTGARAEALGDRLMADAAVAQSRGQHLWTAVAAFRVTEDRAHRAATDPEAAWVLLDGENLASLSIGCFICEEPLTTRLLARRCKGEPRG